MLWLLLAGCPWITESDLAPYRDLDRDGFDATNKGGTDCDDTDASVHPGALEVCDGRDNDCDRLADDDDPDIAGLDNDCDNAMTDYDDVDGDGLGAAGRLACLAPEPSAPIGGDCDDDDARVTRWSYADLDGDGFGDTNVSQEACLDGDGWSLYPGDCDDRDVLVFPGAAEEIARDGVDNNCDGGTDLDDDDGDGLPDFPASDPCAGVQGQEHLVPDDFPEIRDALASGSVAACDTLRVRSGSYRSFVLERPVRIVAEDGAAVRVEAQLLDEVGITVSLPAGRAAVIDRIDVVGFPIGLDHRSGHLRAAVDVSDGELGVRLLASAFQAPEPRLELVSSRLSGLIRAIVQVEGRLILQAVEIEEVLSIGSVVELGGLGASATLIDVAIHDSVASDGAVVAFTSFGEFDVEGLRLQGNVGSPLAASAFTSSLTDVEIRDCVSADASFVSLASTGMHVSGLVVVDNLWQPASAFAATGMVEIASGIGTQTLSDVTLRGNLLPSDRAHLSQAGVLSSNTLSHIAIVGDGGIGLSVGNLLSATVLEHLTLIGLDLALSVDTPLSEDLEITRSIFAGNQVVFDNALGGVRLADSALIDNCDLGEVALDATNLVSDEPRFVRYHPDLPASLIDATLMPGSPLKGARCSDGTRCDLGAYSESGWGMERYQDADADGLYDLWECDASDDPACRCFDDDRFQCDARNFVGLGVSDDPDGDGRSAQQEFDGATLPHVADSDDDGLDDAIDPAPLDRDPGEDHCP